MILTGETEVLTEDLVTVTFYYLTRTGLASNLRLQGERPTPNHLRQGT